MLAAYRSRDWSGARILIEECLKLDTPVTRLRTLYDLYTERIDTFEAKPPGKDWDGVTVSTTK
jgi:adenylate cyclase